MTTRMRIAIVFAALMSSLAQAHTADLVVNIDAVNNGLYDDVWNPVAVYLDAGTYTVTPVSSQYPGALYTAFSYIGGRGNFWSPGYTIAFDQTHYESYGYSGLYNSPEDAFAHAVESSLSIPAGRDVYFAIIDSYFADNLGGISLHLVNISPVPEAKSYAMMMVGLGVLGIIAQRRKYGSKTSAL